ncbi:hypothetical protein HYE82_06495 [Streptomyces sp. BR123]|uniref:hypothetical protein n=1 Tax=Streptomyces sp. BR123 TaxID=2749828 RepID=UPI0015C45D61|nr:hypothetical protein [Streptomyces sp. BR123]NXY94048.1 hypothetical protein [Streptomyces sp. BR123]
MTAAALRHIQGAAAEAALAVPGVAALQPSLAARLARAASRVRQLAQAEGTPGQPEAAGIRCGHTPEGGWQVEVRCILRADHRVVDVARHVREDVRAAVTACLDPDDTTGAVTVLVTVTHTL